MANELTVSPQESTLSVKEVTAQVNLIQNIMREVMHSGEHYGTIPGCGDKKVLMKSGAEKLNLTFRMAPDPKIEVIVLGNFHREYRVKCVMRSILTGIILGAGVGSCSTMESKYRWRNAERKCPICHKPAIIKGKKEFGGGWLCYKKKDGCGTQFADGDKTIEDQALGRIENPDIADQYNTCLKMAKKRAMVDAVLTCLAASDIFTQDLDEDLPEENHEAKPQSQPSSAIPKFKKHIDQTSTKQSTSAPEKPKQSKLTDGTRSQILDMGTEMIENKYDGWDLNNGKRLDLRIQKGEMLGDSAVLDEIIKNYNTFLAWMKQPAKQNESEVEF
jgi:hypothetical protein